MVRQDILELYNQGVFEASLNSINDDANVDMLGEACVKSRDCESEDLLCRRFGKEKEGVCVPRDFCSAEHGITCGKGFVCRDNVCIEPGSNANSNADNNSGNSNANNADSGAGNSWNVNRAKQSVSDTVESVKTTATRVQDASDAIGNGIKAVLNFFTK